MAAMYNLTYRVLIAKYNTYLFGPWIIILQYEIDFKQSLVFIMISNCIKFKVINSFHKSLQYPIS